MSAHKEFKTRKFHSADETEEDQAEVPDDLRKRIEERLEGHPEVPWDEVVRDLVEAEEVDAIQ